MRSVLLAAALMILCSALVSAAVPATTVYEISSGIKLQVTLISQEPDPAEPGSLVELSFKIENLGTDTAEDLIFELLPKYPFALYGDTARREVGSIWGRQQGHQGARVKYTLKVSDGAVEGINSIEARYNLKDRDWAKLYPFNVTIKAHEAMLGVESFYLEPARVSPGGASDVYVRIKNYGKSAVKDIRLKLNFSSSTPFVPVNQSNELVINGLSPSKSTVAKFVVGAEPDAAAGSYNVPLFMQYNDAGGRNYSKSSFLGFVVGSEAELLVQIEETDIYTKNSQGKVVVKFINRGLNDLKLMTAKLLGSRDFDIISSNEIYVGNIDSDDYETAEFRLYVKDVKENVVLPVSVEFRDANNNLYKESYSLDMRIYSGGEAKKLGLAEGSRLTGFLIIIFIVVAGVVVYKKWWKKRKKK